MYTCLCFSLLLVYWSVLCQIPCVSSFCQYNWFSYLKYVLLSLSLILLQLRRHGDVFTQGAGAGGQPESHAAEAYGRSRLHHRPPLWLPPHSGQHRRPAVPETIRYSNPKNPQAWYYHMLPNIIREFMTHLKTLHSVWHYISLPFLVGFNQFGMLNGKNITFEAITLGIFNKFVNKMMEWETYHYINW